jgi:periplasmic divalent cation tolerance protein
MQPPLAAVRWGMAGYSIVMTTTDSRDEAELLARSLVAERLAACVQLLPIVSHYVWEDRPTRSEEILLLVKTAAARVPAVTDYIEAHHSYDTPEVIAVPVESGSVRYLGWIDGSVDVGGAGP